MNSITKYSIKEMCIAAVLTALTCVLAPMSVPIGPVPVTLGTFCIFLTGALLPWRLSAISTLVYILIGAVGVPVFSNFKGGIQVLAGPTGGFLIAYPIMAIIISLAVFKFKKKGNTAYILSMAVSMLLSMVFCYLLGTLWFVFSMDSTVSAALSACVIPFIWADLTKIACACILSFSVSKALKAAGLWV